MFRMLLPFSRFVFVKNIQATTIKCRTCYYETQHDTQTRIKAIKDINHAIDAIILLQSHTFLPDSECLPSRIHFIFKSDKADDHSINSVVNYAQYIQNNSRHIRRDYHDKQHFAVQHQSILRYSPIIFRVIMHCLN